MTLYVWLKLFHLLGVVVFLFAHGVSGGASFAIGRSVEADTRRLLRISQISAMVSNPGLVLIVVTGVWMAFLGSYWSRGWVWAAVVILAVTIAGMALFARPYYAAREAKSDDVLSKALTRLNPRAAAGVGAVALVLLVALMVLKPF